MTTVHIAHAVGSTDSTAAKYRVDVRAGSHHMVADEPVAAGGSDLGRSPFGLVLSGLGVLRDVIYDVGVFGGPDPRIFVEHVYGEHFYFGSPDEVDNHH